MDGTKEKAKIKNDMIFIAALLALVAVFGACFLFSRAEGDTVTVTVDGKLFGEYSLSEDRTVEIRAGEGFNLLIIEGGKARVAEASCPDGVCRAHNPISRDGESIICLPNKVVVTVGKSGGDAPDIIV